MNKIKEYWKMMFSILLMNFLFILLYSMAVYASDIKDNLDMNIKYKESYLEKNDDNIYYLNDAVTIQLPEDKMNQEEEISIEISAVKEAHLGEEPAVIIDEFFGMSVWDGDKFSAFEEIKDKETIIGPMDNAVYNQHAVKFKYIKSYKLSYEDNVEKVIDVTYLSPTYQFIFDKTEPEILKEDDKDYEGLITQGTSCRFLIKDTTGISKLELSRNGNLLDSKDLRSEKRMTEYEYEVELVRDGNTNNELKIIATDLAGNISEYIMTYAIDTEAPDISLRSAENGEVLGDGTIYPNSVKVSAISIDNSGKSNIFYKCMYSDGKGETVCVENLTRETQSSEGIFREYSEEGVYDITTFSYDESGNYSEVIKVSFGIDTSAPIVTIENVINGKTYNGPVSIYATLKELFFENASAEIVGTITDENGERALNISPFVIAAKLNRNVYTFTENGRYKIQLSSKDFMNRESKILCDFSIDTEPPKLTIKAVGGSEELGEKINKELHSNEGATIVCNKKPALLIETSDDMSEYEAVTVLYRRNEDGSYKEESIEKAVSVGKQMSFPMEIKGEGEYSLKVTLKDLADNVIEEKVSFIVDEEPPVIGYIDAFNEKYLKYFTLPESMKDYIKDATKYKYKTYLNSKEVGTLDLRKDGKYILQIVAEDEAGNTSEKMAAFIVDSTAPKVIVHGIENEGKIKKDEVLKLTLFDNADFFKSVAVNGERISIDNNKEVNIRASQYGDYNISIVASDYAGNEVTEVVKMQCAMSDNPFKVVIDEKDIKTLTKKDGQIREKFFKKAWGIKMLIFCGIIAAIVVIFRIFSFVDTKKNKG